jgi:hypothetical protein
MRVTIYDQVEPPIPDQLPLRLSQSCARREATIWLAFFVPIALGILCLGAFVLVEAVRVPQARAFALDHPVTGLAILCGLCILTYILTIPARRLVARLGTSRNVYIGDGVVHVLEGSDIRSRSWAEPLSAYLGVAAHMRTSLSGTRHEIILVHPQRDKSVLLSVAPRTTESELARVAALLNQREITPSVLYRLRPLRETISASPMPEAAHA